MPQEKVHGESQAHIYMGEDNDQAIAKEYEEIDGEENDEGE